MILEASATGSIGRSDTRKGLMLATAIGLVSTVDFSLLPSWWDEQRLVLLLVVLMLCAVGAVNTPTGRERRWSRIVCAVLAMGVLSSGLAARPYVGYIEVATYTLALCFIAEAAPTSVRGVRFVATALSAAVAVPYVAGVTARYISAVALSMPVGADTLLVGFANSRFPAHLQALTLPLFPLALTVVTHRASRTALYGVGALWWMCLLGSGSRTAWIAMLAAGVVALLVQGPRGAWMRVQLALALSGAALYAIGFYAVPDVLGIESAVETGRFSEFASVGARAGLWKHAVAAIVESPWLGVGPMHLALFNNGIAAHPHNFWLQVLAEWGVPAGITVIVASFLLWLKTVRFAYHAERHSVAREDAQAAIAVATAMTAWIVAIQGDGIMVVPTSQAASAIVLALALGLVARREAPARRTGLQRALGVGVFASAALVLASLALSPFSDVQLREEAWRAAHPGERFLPRFWQQGFIGPADDPTARQPVFSRN